MAPYHTAQADQGPFTTEALGDADRGCAGMKAKVGLARRLPMIMHHMLAEKAPSTLQKSERRSQVGPGATSGLLETKCLCRVVGSR
jgi:hypothetical protein